jgi:hypothetical protein
LLMLGIESWIVQPVAKSLLQLSYVFMYHGWNVRLNSHWHLMQSLYKPEQALRLPEFLGNRHTKMARLAATRSGRMCLRKQ